MRGGIDRFPIARRGIREEARTIRTIHCRCGEVAEITDNTRTGLPISKVAEKFRQNGWLIGHNENHDKCPACQVKPAKPRKEQPVAQNNPDPAKPTPHVEAAPDRVVQLVPPAPEPPRQPTREDRRLIVDELDRTYDLTNMRYPGKLDDAALAARLDVPRAWVAELREQLYGPEANEAQAQREAAYIDLTTRLDKAEADLEAALTKFSNDIGVIRGDLGSLKAK